MRTRAATPRGDILSGWQMRWAGRPAAIAEPHSETPYTTERAIDFMREAGDRPWLLHLSYIKPHWPYVAPAPYHAMYSARTTCWRPTAARPSSKTRIRSCTATGRSRERELWPRRSARARSCPTYMGLVKQIDDQLGRLFAFLRDSGLERDTLVVFTSDHGDYLGDHWLGEKELFHEPIVRVPLIVADPRAACDRRAAARPTRSSNASTSRRRSSRRSGSSSPSSGSKAAR